MSALDNYYTDEQASNEQEEFNTKVKKLASLISLSELTKDISSDAYQRIVLPRLIEAELEIQEIKKNSPHLML